MLNWSLSNGGRGIDNYLLGKVMSCLPQSKIAEIQAQLQKKQAQLALAEVAYERALSEIESYKFDAGEGSQQVKRRKIAELANQIDRLEAQINGLERKLAGGGLINVNLRRCY